MSKMNGDKSRFHVARKQNIKKRAKTRELLVSLAAAGKSMSKKTSETSPSKARKIS